MAGFDGTEIAERFDYKNLGHGIPDGRVPMPTMAEARKYRDTYTIAQKRVTGLEDLDIETEDGNKRLQEALDSLTATQRDDLIDQLIEAAVELCNGHPSRDELLRLDGVTQAAFASWLYRELSPLF